MSKVTSGHGYSATKWAMDPEQVAGLGSSARHVLLAIAWHCDDRYSAFPQISRLCDITGLSKATVHRAIGELEKKGFLMRAERLENTKGSRSTRYYLNHPLAAHVTGEPEHDPVVQAELDKASRRAIIARGAIPLDRRLTVSPPKSHHDTFTVSL